MNKVHIILNLIEFILINIYILYYIYRFIVVTGNIISDQWAGKPTGGAETKRKTFKTFKSLKIKN